MLRLQFDSVLGFNVLVVLADVEIIGYPRVELGGGGRDFCLIVLREDERGRCCPLESKTI